MAATKDTKPEPPPEDHKAELEALMTIARVLEPLNGAQRQRILRYVRDKFGVWMGTD